MRIKELLSKPGLELTDEELRYIADYFLKHPEKLQPRKKPEYHKCIDCKHLIWWDNLGWTIWKCLKKDNEMTTKMVTHKRKCDLFDEDENLRITANSNINYGNRN